jgi:hypothetical protein
MKSVNTGFWQGKRPLRRPRPTPRRENIKRELEEIG